jgi:hypothetical protein
MGVRMGLGRNRCKFFDFGGIGRVDLTCASIRVYNQGVDES